MFLIQTFLSPDVFMTTIVFLPNLLCDAQARWFKAHERELAPRVREYYLANESSPGGRQLNSDLVNGIVMRDENGYYSFDLGNPYVEDRRL